MTDKSDYQQSLFREKMLEYVFLAELLQDAWLVRGRTVEVLRPDVDDSGYDLVLACGGVTRYIQLKSSTKNITVNVRLEDKPGGCVILLVYKAVDCRADVKYRFFGKHPNTKLKLGDKKGTNTTTGKERQNTRKINIGCFDKPTGVHKLFDKLFPESNLSD